MFKNRYWIRHTLRGRRILEKKGVMGLSHALLHMHCKSVKPRGEDELLLQTISTKYCNSNLVRMIFLSYLSMSGKKVLYPLVKKDSCLPAGLSYSRLCGFYRHLFQAFTLVVHIKYLLGLLKSSPISGHSEWVAYLNKMACQFFDNKDYLYWNSSLSPPLVSKSFLKFFIYGFCFGLVKSFKCKSIIGMALGFECALSKFTDYSKLKDKLIFVSWPDISYKPIWIIEAEKYFSSQSCLFFYATTFQHKQQKGNILVQNWMFEFLRWDTVVLWGKEQEKFLLVNYRSNFEMRKLLFLLPDSYDLKNSTSCSLSKSLIAFFDVPRRDFYYSIMDFPHDFFKYRRFKAACLDFIAIAEQTGLLPVFKVKRKMPRAHKGWSKLLGDLENANALVMDGAAGFDQTCVVLGYPSATPVDFASLNDVPIASVIESVK